MAGVVDRHLAFAHGFQERALCAGRGPIDLIGQEDIRKHRAGSKLKLTGLLVEEREAGDVGGEQVGGALDAGKTSAREIRKGLGQRRFAKAGRILNQQVAAGEEAGQRQVAGVVFSTQGSPQLLPHSVDRSLGRDRGLKGSCRHVWNPSGMLAAASRGRGSRHKRRWGRPWPLRSAASETAASAARASCWWSSGARHSRPMP